MMNAKIWYAKNRDGERLKFLQSETYNYAFNMASGYFERWGKTQEDDPSWSPFGPEIMDIEISADGGCPQACPFCYKGNKKDGEVTNMSLETFKKIFATFPKTITQIAFGITGIHANPDLFNIFEYCRENGVIPNVTVSSGDKLTDEDVTRLISLCGAMAFSVYSWNPRETRYDLIERFLKAGLKQCNIHFMISNQTIKFAYEVIDDIKNNPKLKGLNAIVFLGLKPKNRGQAFDVLPTTEFITLVNYCLTNEVRFGFDSCSAGRFEKAVSISNLEEAKKQMLMNCSERCESGLFSAYIDARGKYWHCSFGEDRPDAFGIDVTKVNSFLKEVWLAPEMKTWREKLFTLNRECPLYPEIHASKE